jgi:hypothetical protein
LNQDDNKVYKFNSFRQLEVIFGGLDYGAGSLFQPDDLLINGQNFIFVPDAENQKVSVFDLYGVYQYSLELKMPFRWTKISLIGPYILFFDAKNLFFYNLTSKKIRHIQSPLANPLIDISGNKDFIYLLTEKAINLYPLENRQKNEREH